MKDIDFDELDKAVNSLMGGIKDTSDQPKPKTLTIATTLKDDEQPKYDNIQQAAQKIGSETILGPVENTTIISPSNPDDAELTVLTLNSKLEDIHPKITPATENIVEPPLPMSPPVETTEPPADGEIAAEQVQQETVTRPSSGRFMDVMHPSSDMKSALQQSAPSEPVIPAIVVPSRVARDIPRPATQPDKVVISTPVIAAPPTPEPEVTIATEPIETNTVAAVDAPVDEEKQLEALLDTPTETVPSQEPLVSPFLPDAKEKVEKRPLGGAQPPEVSDAVFLEDSFKSEDSARGDAQLAPVIAPAEIPAEYHTDLLAIETGAILEPTPPASETSSDSSLDNGAPQTATATNSTATPVEAPAQTPAETGAIYDTNEYHKPVAHPAKAKSGWLLVIIIIVIVIICAGGATAFYLINA